jgi:hypothetical protein
MLLKTKGVCGRQGSGAGMYMKTNVLIQILGMLLKKQGLS